MCTLVMLDLSVVKCRKVNNKPNEKQTMWLQARWDWGPGPLWVHWAQSLRPRVTTHGMSASKFTDKYFKVFCTDGRWNEKTQLPCAYRCNLLYTQPLAWATAVLPLVSLGKFCVVLSKWKINESRPQSMCVFRWYVCVGDCVCNKGRFIWINK